MFENEEFASLMHKDGTAIHPSLMAAADDEKKAGEVVWIIDKFWDL